MPLTTSLEYLPKWTSADHDDVFTNNCKVTVPYLFLLGGGLLGLWYYPSSEYLSYTFLHAKSNDTKSSHRHCEVPSVAFAIQLRRRSTRHW